MTLIIVTLSILTVGILLGFGYNYLLMYTDVFKNLKIRSQQLDKPLSRSEFFKRVPLIAFNVICLYILSFFGLWFGQGIFDMTWAGPGIFVLHFMVIFLVDDLLFYIIHRSMHENKFLHQKVHSVHHQASQPFPLDFIYAHPVEWLAGYAGAFAGVMLLFIFSPVNVWAFWAWCAFRSIHELDIHSGVRSVVAKYIPLLAGAEHHDFHHQRSKGNYSSTLVLWDLIMGTMLKKKA